MRSIQWYLKIKDFSCICTVLVCFSSKPICSYYFCGFQKSPRPKWPIYKHESDKNKKVWLSVVLEFCLSLPSSIACLQPRAYISLCWGLKHLLKIWRIILVYPNVARFLNFETLCSGRSKTLTYVRKKYHNNERYLCFVTHIFTKLLQDVCLSIRTFLCLKSRIKLLKICFSKNLFSR